MDEPEQTPTDPHFDELMLAIGAHLQRADSYEDASLRLTTQQVYEKLQEFYPSPNYTMHNVFVALKELEYCYEDTFRQMEYRWLFK